MRTFKMFSSFFQPSDANWNQPEGNANVMKQKKSDHHEHTLLDQTVSLDTKADNYKAMSIGEEIFQNYSNAMVYIPVVDLPLVRYVNQFRY